MQLPCVDVKCPPHIENICFWMPRKHLDVCGRRQKDSEYFGFEHVRMSLEKLFALTYQHF